MPVTGLRSRFFVTTLVVLMVVAAGALYLENIFIREERLKLIDQQVRETAAALVDSQLGDLRKIDFDEADDIISEELGETRIGKFFIIRNANREVIFESASATLLPISEIPNDQQWFEVSQEGRFIRGLNLKLPRFPDRTLQVGVVLDESILNPGYFSKSSFYFISVVFFLGMIMSFALTSFLLRPIAKLDKFLADVTLASRKKTLLPIVPESIFKSPNAESRDEFERVVASLNALISKVNKNYEFSRYWAYQMAHELKTPLSLANLEIERLQKRLDLAPSDVREINSENRKISDTINSFLGWAELENSAQHKHLYMNRLGSMIREITLRLNADSDRIKPVIECDPVVPANPQHLEQLIQNLLVNALVHTGSSRVEVKVTSNTNADITSFRVEISDHGPGLPNEVLDRLGEPFNKGNSINQERKGHGLGLAWANSICRLYGWELSFSNLNPGTKVTIQFREEGWPTSVGTPSGALGNSRISQS